jgi:hypothetical protein
MYSRHSYTCTLLHEAPKGCGCCCIVKESVITRQVDFDLVYRNNSGRAHQSGICHVQVDKAAYKTAHVNVNPGDPTEQVDYRLTDSTRPHAFQRLSGLGAPWLSLRIGSPSSSAAKRPCSSATY